MAADCLERLHRLFPRENEGDEPGPGDSPFNGTATLRTDTVYGSLRKPAKAYRPRSHSFPVLVTALRFQKPGGLFVLDAHPCVVFGKESPLPKDPAEAMTDGGLPVAERRFDHLFHFGTDHGETALRANRYSYLGARALFMREEYAELAHFMVLKELTARFERVTLSLDGKYTAYRSAAAVFAGDMRTRVARKKEKGDGNPDSDIRRAEIAVVQTQSPDAARQSAGTPIPEWGAETERVGEVWRDRIGAELAKEGPDLLGDKDTQRRARAKAELLVQVMHGAWSERGSWGWCERSGWDDRRLAVLWLSQGTDRDWPPSEEIEAFVDLASPQSVDSAIGVLRRRAQALARPPSRAQPGRSFNESMENAEQASYQVWVSRFDANYIRSRDFLIAGKQPAHWLGLLPWEEAHGMRIVSHGTSRTRQAESWVLRPHRLHWTGGWNAFGSWTQAFLPSQRLGQRGGSGGRCAGRVKLRLRKPACPGEVCAGEVCAGEVCAGEVRKGEVCAGEVCPGELRPGEVREEESGPG